MDDDPPLGRHPKRSHERFDIGRVSSFGGGVNSAALGDSAADSFVNLLDVAGPEEDDVAIAQAEQAAKAEKERAAVAYVKVLHIEVFSLVVYLMLVGLLSAVLILSRRGQFDYYFAEMVRELILGSELETADTEISKTFYDIGSLEEIYMFLRGPLLAALYVETSFTGRPLPPGEMHRVLDGNSLLLGVVRLQQVRVRPDSCSVPGVFEVNGTSATTIPHCYVAWPESIDSRNIDNSPIVGGGDVCAAGAASSGGGSSGLGAAECAARTYEWADTSVTGLGTFNGLHARYDGAGYMVELPSELAMARAKLQELEEDGFLGQGTRALWVDFALYSVNINRFCTVRLLFERLESGTIAPSATVLPLSLLWYDSGDGISRLIIAEFCLLCLVLFFIGYELKAMRREGMRAYWSNASNWYDWPSLLGFFFVGFCRYRAWYAMRRIKRDVAADGEDGAIDVYLDLQEVASWAVAEQMVFAIDSLCVYLKVLHFLSGIPYISTLLQTLVRARQQLCYFILCLAILIVAFATSFHLASGASLPAWRNVGVSMMSLLHFTLGSVDLGELHRDNPSIGPLLYVTFVFLVIFVSISIFVAIVTDAYAAEKKEAIAVDLVQVLRDASRRQARAVAARLRVWQARANDRLTSLRASFHSAAGSFKRATASFTRRQPRDERADTLNSHTSGDSFQSRLRAKTASEEAWAAAEAARQAQREANAEAERTLEELAQTRGAMEGGHLFILNGVSTQLKSMCFRQDTRDPSTRTPIQTALAELERLRALNDALKARAHQEGWEWHLGSAQLLPAAITAADGSGGAAPARTDAATGVAAGGGASGRAASASVSGSCTGDAITAILRARQLARGYKTRVFGGGGGGHTAGTNTDAEDAEVLDARILEPGLHIETTAAGEGKLVAGRSPGVTSPTTKKRHRRKHPKSLSPDR